MRIASIFAVTVASFGLLAAAVYPLVQVNAENGAAVAADSLMAVDAADAQMANRVLDPMPGRDFLVAVRVKVDRLPTGKRRSILISKNAPTKRGDLRGWAIGLRRYDTSLRPVVLWQGNNGGNWFDFENVPLVAGLEYTFFLFARPGEFLSLYLQSQEKGAPVLFAGAFDISRIGLPQTAAPLVFGHASESRLSFRGSLLQAIAAYPDDKLRSIAEISRFLDGGSEALLDKLAPEEINLLIDEKGEDHSRFRRSERFSLSK